MAHREGHRDSAWHNIQILQRDSASSPIDDIHYSIEAMERKLSLISFPNAVKQKLRRSQSLLANISPGQQSVSASTNNFMYLIDTESALSNEEASKIEIPDQMRTVRFKRKIPTHNNSKNIQNLFPSDKEGSSPTSVTPCEEITPSWQTYSRKNYKDFLPSVSELLFGSGSIESESSEDRVSNSKNISHFQAEPVQNERKTTFGMWDGVVARNLMQIFGGVMFLRLGATFGQAGLALGTAMIFGCSIMTIITALSLSAIATNGTPHSGGIYYLLSRSLGPKFGGAIGTLMIAGYASDLSIFIVTFAEALLDQINTYAPDFSIVDRGWDIKLIELLALLTLAIIVCCGVEAVVMVFSIFLIIMLLCLGSIYLGSFLSAPKPQVGFVGASVATLQSNLWPQFYSSNSTMSVLILFFPAMTGFTAAGTLYSELRTPEKSFPRGTLIAIGISSCTYIISGWVLGSSCVREVDGDQGLVFRRMIMADVSLWSPLVYFGIYASTLTSALGALMTGPRILFAMCQDQLFPSLNQALNKVPAVKISMKNLKVFLSSNRDSNQVRQPSLNRCLIFFCIIPAFVALFGSPNANARLSSGANLLLFMLINYAVFAASFAASPAWRPTFKYSNKWVSLIGFFLCAATLMFVNAFASITCIITGVVLYKYLAVTTSRNRYRFDWGTTAETLAFTTAIKSLNNLKRTPQTSKTYRPNFLILSGSPGDRPDLIKATDLLRAGHGLSIYANVVIYRDGGNKWRYMKKLSCSTALRQRLQDYLSSDLRVKGFASVIVAGSLAEAVRSLIMTSGVTPHLSANVVCLGFKNDWLHQPAVDLDEYVGILQTSLALNAGIAVVRNAHLFSAEAEGKDSIDVWWLFDDGGLTVLLGYLLTKSPRFKKKPIKLRLMTVITSSSAHEIARMYGLLKQLRIPAEVVGLNASLDARGHFRPSQSCVEQFQTLTNGGELDKLTLKILHVSELIQSHSQNALATAVTIPVPSIAYTSNKVMAWMDCLSCTPTTTFLIRGNQINVLYKLPIVSISNKIKLGCMRDWEAIRSR